MAVSELDLVQRASAGDGEAFGELVDRYRDMVYGLGYHLTGEFEAARDLAQEAFVQAYRRLGQLREPEHFAGWLRRITLNCHRSETRRTRVRTVALTEAEATPTSSLPSDVELVVREALARLRPPERLALTLHYINGYSHAEIGGFVGVRPEVVNSRLARARRHLREEVLAMAGEMFDEHALPPEFRKDVVAAVGGLVAKLEAVLPRDLAEAVARIHREQDELWCSILDRMPAPYGRPLAEEGEAPRARMAQLPESLHSDLRRATCLTWVDWVLGKATERPPWIDDPERLWICFYEEQSSCALAADGPGPGGYIVTLLIGPEEGDPQGPPAPAEEVARVLASCAVPAEFREILPRLRRILPGVPGSLGAALHTEMERLMRQVRDDLPAEVRAAMEGGTNLADQYYVFHEASPDLRRALEGRRAVPARDLPPALREVLRRAMFLLWGHYVVGLVEHAPSWLLRFEEAEVEFGLLPSGWQAKDAGQPYIKLHGRQSTFADNIECPLAAGEPPT